MLRSELPGKPTHHLPLASHSLVLYQEMVRQEPPHQKPPEPQGYKLLFFTSLQPTALAEPAGPAQERHVDLDADTNVPGFKVLLYQSLTAMGSVMRECLLVFGCEMCLQKAPALKA